MNLNSVERLQSSIETMNTTLEFLRYPQECSGLEDLPKENVSILFDLVSSFTEKRKAEFSSLLRILKTQIFLKHQATISASRHTINWSFQTGQDYQKYTEEGYPEYLQSLVNCFIYSKGQEILGIHPVISLESLEILTRDAIDFSDPLCSSPHLRSLAHLFTKKADFSSKFSFDDFLFQ
jgi:hypothetical protein